MLRPVNKAIRAGALHLGVGTGLAQIVALAAAPIITRLYSPSDFGEFGIYSALLAVLTVVVCLRFDLAIVLPDQSRDAAATLALSILAVHVVALATALILVAYEDRLSVWLGLPSTSKSLLLLPVSLYFVGLSQAITYWLTRVRDYKGLGISKVSQSVPQTTTQWVLGMLSLGAVGLVLSDILGKMTGLLSLWWRARRDLQTYGKDLNGTDIRNVARRYLRFSATSVPAGLINEIGSAAPTLLLAALFGSTAAGMYTLVQRVMALPMDLVGRSVASIFMGEASLLGRESPNQLRGLFLRYAATLFALGLVPAVAIVCAAPTIFSWVFGAPWSEAGVYAQILSGAFVCRFAIAPLGQILNIIGRPDLQLRWDVVRVGLIVASLVIPYELGLSAVSAVTAYALAIVIVQLLYVAIVLAHLRRSLQ